MLARVTATNVQFRHSGAPVLQICRSSCHPQGARKPSWKRSLMVRGFVRSVKSEALSSEWKCTKELGYIGTGLMELPGHIGSDADLEDTWKTWKMLHIVTHKIHSMLEYAPLETVLQHVLNTNWFASSWKERPFAQLRLWLCFFKAGKPGP